MGTVQKTESYRVIERLITSNWAGESFPSISGLRQAKGSSFMLPGVAEHPQGFRAHVKQKRTLDFAPCRRGLFQYLDMTTGCDYSHFLALASCSLLLAPSLLLRASCSGFFTLQRAAHHSQNTMTDPDDSCLHLPGNRRINPLDSIHNRC